MRADVCRAFAQTRGFFDVLQVVEFTFEASQRVEHSGVIVAALFEEGLAIMERHATRSTWKPRRLHGKDGEEHARAVFQSCAGTFDR